MAKPQATATATAPKAARAAAAPPPPPMQEPVDAADAAGSEGGGALVVDFSTVPDQVDFPITPKGIYPAVVDDVSFGLSQSSGNPMWTWVFELTPEADAIAEGVAGRKFYFHTPFVENMMPRVKRVLARIAPELLEGPIEPEQVAIDGTLVGRSCRIRLDIKQYEGKPRNNVRDVLPPDDDGAAGGPGFLQA